MSQQTEKLGTEPVGRLFLTMGLPMILGMLVNGLYSIVDAIFVTRGVGSLAIGGISIVFPLQMIIFAFAAVLGSGSASIISRKLGAREPELARRTAQSTLMFSILFAVVLTLIVRYSLAPILNLLGVTPALKPYAVDYLMPLLTFMPITILAAIFNDLLRAEGKMQLMVMVITLGSLLNIALDPIFIFVLDMGVRGAALATIIAQSVSLALALSFYLRRRTAIQLSLRDWGIDFRVIARVVALGLPFFVSHAGASFMIGLTNNALSSVGGDAAELYISAYGLIGRVLMFVILPLVGIMITFQTITGYNYGAENFARVQHTIRIGLSTTTVICLLVSMLMLLIPKTILSVFTSDPELLAQAAFISRRLFLAFSLVGVTFIATGFFQATGHAQLALICSSARVYLFLVPALLLLPRMLGISGIWLSFPLADIAAALLTGTLFFRFYRTLQMTDLTQPSP